MTTIPEHIAEQARALYHSLPIYDEDADHRENIEMIAAALIAAEKRGREGERERACKILIGIADEIAKQALNKIEAQLGKSIASCAATIRSGQ